MVFLPEASDFIGPPSSYPSLTTTLEESVFVKGIRSAAKTNDCWVSVGVHEKSEDPQRCYNTAIIISNQGEIQQAYRKLHLFDIDLDRDTISNESKFISPGQDFKIPLSTPVGKVGQLICYDIRFPEVGIMHRQHGAEVLIYPSAFMPKTGEAHWEILLRARAIENQCFVFGAAQVGSHSENPPRHSWGHAMIVDPWGTVIARVPGRDSSKAVSGAKAELEKDESTTSFALADIDLKVMHELRSSMPVLAHRRNDVYPKLD
ncbi:hypothetical protein CROQUDRAFT_49555 [Cronartium quercuum f. sp. fusiforme G11]|uniref:CN hydrolase domain-containing protein n=1 Tax=Cronartium quercuum f. sp. fusiforme G11 TaxID=708437 RepID=A0A9P6T9V0_9BASI|nr:hypothetical protein CROQUDRAFT_49555 [Cronartium quercuum f. sp. fusiforme G11]